MSAALEFLELEPLDLLEEEFSRKAINRMVKKIDKENKKEAEIAKIKLSDLINKNFYPVAKSKAANKILKGGRSSLKSSYVSLKLVTDFKKDDKANVVSFRKVGLYLRGSVYSQIAWAISKLNLDKEFKFFKSPLAIIHKATNTGFYFFGVDDPQKIKSTKVINGYVRYLWYEEAAEFKDFEEIDITQDTFVRENLVDDNGDMIEVETYFTYNPPRSEYDWINEWTDSKEGEKNWLVHHSTYEEDEKGFLSKQFLEKVVKIKENDPEYHDWMYLGKVTGVQGKIYNMKLFQPLQALPEDDKVIYYDIVMDTGYSVSATTFLLFAYTVKGKVILLDTWYYSPKDQMIKKAPSDFSEEFYKFKKKHEAAYNMVTDYDIIDSADGALRNQVMKDYNLYLKPAKKKEKTVMIEEVRALLAEGRFYYLDTENNKVFIDEHKKYQWDEDWNKKHPDKPRVIKVDDHTCDAFQYYVMNNLTKIGLR